MDYFLLPDLQRECQPRLKLHYSLRHNYRGYLLITPLSFWFINAL
jgi:hypothetical protein